MSDTGGSKKCLGRYNTWSRYGTDPPSTYWWAVETITLRTGLFRFPKVGEIRLSPAYDIVPTILYQPRGELALRFVGTNRFESVNLHRFERLGSYLGIDPKWA